MSYWDMYAWGRIPWDKSIVEVNKSIVEVKKWINDDIKKEDKSMQENKKELEGFTRVAAIEIDGNGPYYYALYDETVTIGDMVTVTGRAEGKLCKVVDVLTVNEAKEHYSKPLCAEVTGVLDDSKYKARKAKRDELAKLRAQMDKLIAQIDENTLYARYAEVDPGMKELFAKYTAVRNA